MSILMAIVEYHTEALLSLIVEHWLPFSILLEWKIYENPSKLMLCVEKSDNNKVSGTMILKY